MKNRLQSFLHLAQVFIGSATSFIVISGSADAASDSWNVDAAGDWTDTTKWFTGTQAPGSTTTDNADVATFAFTLTAGRIVTVDTSRFIGGISFGNASGFGYTLSGGGLILNNGGVIQTLAGNGNHTDTISTPIKISGTSAATATFTAEATSTTSLLSIGAVTGSATAGNTTTLTLNGTNTGANAITGIIGDGSGGGKLSITKSGAGTWVLSGNNTYTGGTFVNEGTLNIGFANTSAHALSGGYSVATGAVLNMDFGNQTTSYLINTIAGNIVVDGTLNLASKSTGNDGSVLQGSAPGFGISGAGVINKNDTGKLEFGGWAPATNALSLASFSGTINVNAGTLGMNYQGAPTFGSTTMTLNISSGAIFDMRAGSMQVDKLTGSGTLTNSNAATVGTLTVGANNGSSQFNGVINTGLSLTKAGTGTLTLSGSSITYSGATSITEGTLKLSDMGNGTFGSAISVAAGTTLELNSNTGFSTVDTMVLNGGAITGTGTITKTGVGMVEYRNTTVMKDFSGTVDIQAGSFGSGFATGTLGKVGSVMKINVGASGLFDLRGSGANAAIIDMLTGSGVVGTTHNIASTLTVGTAGGSSQFDGVIAGNATSGTNNTANPNAAAISLVKTGAGIFTLTGANTYSGTTTISSGTLQIGNGGTSGTLGTGAVTNNAILAFNRADSISVGNAVGGSGAVQKNGTGMLTLSGTNTYTGTTTVDAGTLKVSGSIGGSDVTVNNSGVLASDTIGTIGKSVTINNGANLAAGGQNAIGTATVTTTTTLNSGGIFAWDLDAPTADTTLASDQGSYDRLKSTSMSGTGAVFQIVLAAGDNFANAFWDTNKTWTNIFTNSSNATIDWTSVFSGGFGGSVSSTGLVEGQGQFTFNGSNTLQWSAVPEPTSALAALLVTAGFLRRRRHCPAFRS